MKRRLCPSPDPAGPRIEPISPSAPSPGGPGIATTPGWELPADLSLASGKAALLKLCLDSVQQLGASDLACARNRFMVRKGAVGEPTPARPEMLTTLLTYCYATGLYASEDIELAARTDATLRYICAGYRPDEQTLRRFRRHHRVLLRTALVHVFTQTWAFHFEKGEADYAGCDWFEAELTTRLERSATSRLDVAALLDEVG